jgi:hypothetical protein
MLKLSISEGPISPLTPGCGGRASFLLDRHSLVFCCGISSLSPDKGDTMAMIHCWTVVRRVLTYRPRVTIPYVIPRLTTIGPIRPIVTLGTMTVCVSAPLEWLPGTFPEAPVEPTPGTPQRSVKPLHGALYGGRKSDPETHLVTSQYTPTGNVPEPSTLVILATAIFILFLFTSHRGRRRHAHHDHH